MSFAVQLLQLRSLLCLHSKEKVLGASCELYAKLVKLLVSYLKRALKSIIEHIKVFVHVFAQKELHLQLSFQLDFQKNTKCRSFKELERGFVGIERKISERKVSM